MAEPVAPAAWNSLIADALRGCGIRTVFQPIIDLSRTRVVGYEALTRFDTRSGHVAPPDVWFKAAHDLGVGPELEAVALRRALAHRCDLPPSCFLSVNVEPDHLATPLVSDIFAEQRDLRGLVVEFTEHRTTDLELIAPEIAHLRRMGALLAIDDAGAGHSGLNRVLQLRPSIIKLDRGLVCDIDRDEAKVALVEMVGVFANRVDAWVVAEGIETMGEAARLVALDVPLAQGYLFGRPAAPWAPLDAAVAAALPSKRSEDPDSVGNLVTVLPTVLADDLAESRPRRRDVAWEVVVDASELPLGIVPVGATDQAAIVPTLKVRVDSAVGEVAQRVCAAVAEPALPFLVIDKRGRYVGAVTVRRLLGELSSRILAGRSGSSLRSAS